MCKCVIARGLRLEGDESCGAAAGYVTVWAMNEVELNVPAVAVFVQLVVLLAGLARHPVAVHQVAQRSPHAGTTRPPSINYMYFLFSTIAFTP